MLRRCYWPINNKNHTGTWCDEIAQIPSPSPEHCCAQCVANSSASPSVRDTPRPPTRPPAAHSLAPPTIQAHSGTMNCTGFAYNFEAQLCFMKALAVMNVTGHPVKSTDTSGRLIFKSDDEDRSSPCPAATPSLVASGVPFNGTTWSVCQRPAPGGDLLFTPASGATPVTIARSAEALYGEGTWLGLNVSDIKASPAEHAWC